MTDISTLRTAHRRTRCLEMRQQGRSYRAIATALHISERTARGYVSRALRDLGATEHASAERLRDTLLERIATARNAIADQVASGDLKAIDRWIKLNAQEAELRGLKGNPGGKPKYEIVVTYVRPDDPPGQPPHSDPDRPAGAVPAPA